MKKRITDQNYYSFQTVFITGSITLFANVKFITFMHINEKS